MYYVLGNGREHPMNEMDKLRLACQQWLEGELDDDVMVGAIVEFAGIAEGVNLEDFANAIVQRKEGK